MAASASASTQLPAMPLDAWAETKQTLHRFVQIVGKIRLAESVRRNHWWNVPFHVTGQGITTRPMGTDPIFTIDFDFVTHRLAEGHQLRVLVRRRHDPGTGVLRMRGAGAGRARLSRWRHRSARLLILADPGDRG